MAVSPDLGATPLAERRPAPDLARGGMLLLIALANVHVYLYGAPIGPRGYPAELSPADRVVVLVQLMFVDGRAYPLFGLLFGYGVTQLARRRFAAGAPAARVVHIVRRRGAWLILIGAGHAALLWSGDIVGAYGLLALLLAGPLVRASDRALKVLAGAAIAVMSLVYAGSGVPVPGDAFLASMTEPDPFTAALIRLAEWGTSSTPLQAASLLGPVAIGVVAARTGVLDDPQRHRALLVRAAVLGIAGAALLGLPLALMGAQLWHPDLGVVLLAGIAHGFGGYLGGIGYAAAFGLLAIRVTATGGGAVSGALLACGRRSLSCYLAQSVAFAFLPAWTFGVGSRIGLWQAALIGFSAWLVILVIADVSERRGTRGPAEVLLRRLTYGPHR
ncbi:Uncharacterized membrane protein YeiB [Pseudonocardia thermophila]|uniref:Uncharacterized membrane protein YeiB n=1 Tax=Pseudonocardia thermophila TaxID=1848 RepID=A0A1M6VSG9_PSETH|nr:DUF418 domain-containing protein [Pseudonocardia thermophila]SHK84285.1 Uncharacterized membrane protein YeiB [Pseudonocardia thermophila]